MRKFILFAALLFVVPVLVIAGDGDAGTMDEVTEMLPGWLEMIISIGGFGTIIRLIGAVAPGFGARIAAAVAKILSPRLGRVIDILYITWQNSQPGSEQGIEWSKKEEEDFWTAIRNFTATTDK